MGMDVESSPESPTLERFAETTSESGDEKNPSDKEAQSDQPQQDGSETTIPVAPDEKTRRAKQSTTQDSLGDAPSRYDSIQATEAAQQRQQQAEENAMMNRPDNQQTLSDADQGRSDNHIPLGAESE